MIFPGMDPYLEAPALWSDLHCRMIVYLAEQLQPLLRPRYVAAIGRRTFSEQARQVHESYLQILDLHTSQRVVTVLEVVSPTNKYAGPGRESYRAKQREVRASEAHLVEIDLLRAGPHILSVPEWVARGQGNYDFLVCVNRAEGKRDKFELYPRRLRERLPRVRIPLAEGDPDVPLDVQAALERVYQVGSFDERIDYRQPCVPPLPPNEQAWAAEHIQSWQPEG